MWSYLEKLSRRECHSCKTSSLARVTQRWPRLRHQRRKPLFACLHHWEDGHRQVYSDRDDGASGFGGMASPSLIRTAILSHASPPPARFRHMTFGLQQLFQISLERGLCFNHGIERLLHLGRQIICFDVLPLQFFPCHCLAPAWSDEKGIRYSS